MAKLMVIGLLLFGFVGLGAFGAWIGDYGPRPCSVLDGQNGCGIRQACEEQSEECCEEIGLEECDVSHEECREDLHKFCEHDYTDEEG